MTNLILGSIYAPDELVEGVNQSKLNGLWWKNFLELPSQDNSLFWEDSNIADNPYNTDDNPNNDVTLTDLAKKNQLDGIQFLAGVFNESGTATRTISIDPQSILFFPIINTFWRPEEDDPQGYPTPNFNDVAPLINSNVDDVDINSLSTSINGVEVPDLFNYRQFPKIEDGFTFKTGGIIDDPSPILGPTYASGYYLAISTLPPELEGHTINFQGVNDPGDDDPDNDFSLNITYNIHYDFNEVTGTNRNDDLSGTQQSDKMEGLDGKDILTGLEGNDNVNGGNGPDTLIGVNPDAENPGFQEIDILRGGEERDTFVLGDSSNAYYLGDGLRDYALIKDLQRIETIELADLDYRFSNETLLGKDGTAISLNGDLVGFVEGITGLTETSPQIILIEQQ